MQIFTAKQKNIASRIFSFDFRMFCVILNVGRSQAACSSHKKVAQSTFSLKTRYEVIRAKGFTQSTLAAVLGRLLQMPNWTQIIDAVDAGFGRAVQAEMAAPALFQTVVLGWRRLWAMSVFSMTVRAEENRAKLAACVRPEIQKVRIC
jgi:hypothetical protein